MAAPLDPPPLQHQIADPKSNMLTPQPWALWFQKLQSSTGTGAPSFGIIAVTNLDNIEATQPTDILTIIAGTNITLETNGVSKSLTINADGGGGEPADPDTSVQFNDGGVFGGNAAFEFKKDVTTVTIGTGHNVGTTGSHNLLVGVGHTVL